MSKSKLIVPQAKKKTMEDLTRLKALPVAQKIPLTLRRIEQFYNHNKGEVYIAFSGGKDSTVLAELVWSLYPDVVGVFSNTGLEYPEIVKFVKKRQSEGRNIVIVKPKMSFKQVIDKYGWAVVSKVQSMAISRYNNGSDEVKHYRKYGGINKKTGKKDTAGTISKKHQYLLDAPFKISDSCCEALKKSPFKVYYKESGNAPIVGTMTHESKLRRDNYLEYGCNAFDKAIPMSTPMAFWNENDVLSFIVDNNIDYCREIYGDIVPTSSMKQMDMFNEDTKEDMKCTGQDRTGCMWCMFGLEQETKKGCGENRFTRMKKTHPKHHNAVINKYGGKEVLDYMGLPYE